MYIKNQFYLKYQQKETKQNNNKNNHNNNNKKHNTKSKKQNYKLTSWDCNETKHINTARTM